MKKISDVFKKIKKWTGNHKTLVALIVTALFVGVHIPLIMNHELSHDEGVVWELSKEVNFSNIFDVNSAEPHPLLWQLLIAPLSQNGLPIISMHILSLVLVAAAVFLFIRFSSFGFFTKLIFALSSAFFYCNPVISRDYSLIPLAICLVCIIYQSRHEKPFRYGLALVLLSQTHFLMYGLLAALVVGFLVEELREKKSAGKKLRALVICFLPLALSVLSSVPVVINSFNNQAIMNHESETYGIDAFAESAIGNYFGIYVRVLNIIVVVALAIMVIGLLADNLKIGLYFLASIAFWFFVMIVIYPQYHYFIHKATIIPILILAALWLIRIEDNKSKNFLGKLFNFSEIVKYLKLHFQHPAFIVPVLFVALNIPYNLIVATHDIDGPYSSSEKIATFVNEKIEENSVIIEADTLASLSFGAPVHTQIEKDNISFYDVPLKTSDGVKSKLRYDGENNQAYTEFTRLKNTELEKLLAEMSEKYEHVYYITSIGKNCRGKEYIYNEGVVSKYEIIGDIDTRDDVYVDLSTQTLLNVYKIK